MVLLWTRSQKIIQVRTPAASNMVIPSNIASALPENEAPTALRINATAPLIIAALATPNQTLPAKCFWFILRSVPKTIPIISAASNPSRSANK